MPTTLEVAVAAMAPKATKAMKATKAKKATKAMNVGMAAKVTRTKVWPTTWTGLYYVWKLSGLHQNKGKVTETWSCTLRPGWAMKAMKAKKASPAMKAKAMKAMKAMKAKK